MGLEKGVSGVSDGDFIKSEGLVVLEAALAALSLMTLLSLGLGASRPESFLMRLLVLRLLDLLEQLSSRADCGVRAGGALLGGIADIVGWALLHEGAGVGTVEPVRAVKLWDFRLCGVRAVELWDISPVCWGVLC